MAIKCRLCGMEGYNMTSGFLARVNPKGEIGIWECRPMCGADLPNDHAMMLAIEHEEEPTVFIEQGKE